MLKFITECGYLNEKEDRQGRKEINEREKERDTIHSLIFRIETSYL
jgi:hypothetical protein